MSRSLPPASRPLAARKCIRLGCALGSWLLLVTAGLAGAQGFPSPAPRVLSSYTLTLRHQPTAEAVALVRTLLSPAGSVEVKETAALWWCDELAALSRIVGAAQHRSGGAGPPLGAAGLGGIAADQVRRRCGRR